MTKRIYTAFLLTLFGAHAYAEYTSCTSIENALDWRVNCLYMGPKGQAHKSILITSKKQLTPKQALNDLTLAIGLLEAGGISPDIIAFETGPKHSGEWLQVTGAPVKLPNAEHPVNALRKIVQICRMVDWSEKCRPYK